MRAAGEHLRDQLSAYLDAALPPEERAAVQAHLVGCAGCRRQLEELRAVSSLVARLPDQAPRRSLVPGRSLPGWLVPARWASSLAAAAFVLVFAVSSVGLPAGVAALRPAGPAVAPLASAALPYASPPVPAPTVSDVRGFSAPGAAASPARESTKQRSEATSAPDAVSTQEHATRIPRGFAPSGDLGLASRAPERPATWPWLVAAIFAAAIAIALDIMIRRRRAG